MPHREMALQGEEATVKVLFSSSGQWFSVYVYSPGPGQFTAIFTDISAQKRVEHERDTLMEPHRAAGAEPHYAALWKWHALEETEHKAVAFDVWETVMGRGPRAYAIRCLGLALATVIFWGLVIPVFLQVLRTEGKLTDVKGWAKFFRYTFGDIGLLRIQLKNYADYFRPGFHSWGHDNRENLLQIDAFLEAQEKLVA